MSFVKRRAQVEFEAELTGRTVSHVNVPSYQTYICCRYDADKQELVSQEVGVAYPVVAGIPRLMPIAGRLIDNASSNTNQ